MQPGAEVADQVYRLGTEVVSFYVLEAGGRLTVVDAGGAGHFSQLLDFLDRRGWALGAIDAVLLTHAHSDHVGFAEQARTEADARVMIHEADAVIARGGDDGRSTESGMLRYLWRPALYRTVFDLARARGINMVPVEEVATFDDGETLDVPGRPRVVHAPGHTRGNAALHIADRDLVFSGDALVTWNTLTGRHGPQIMPSAFNESSDQALASLTQLEGIGASVVLPGHGRPWTDGVDQAVERARQAGRS